MNLDFTYFSKYTSKTEGSSFENRPNIFSGPDGTVEVEYISDRIQQCVPLNKIKKSSTVIPGDIREVKWENGCFYPACIVKLSKSLLNVITTCVMKGQRVSAIKIDQLQNISQ